MESYILRVSCKVNVGLHLLCKRPEVFMIPLNSFLKETKSVTMNIFRKRTILFKSFVKIELSYVFTINMLSTTESCIEQ